MSSTPRILRAHTDHAAVPCPPRPVIARLWWRHLGTARDAQAWAISEGPNATLIVWDDTVSVREDWIPTRDLRDPGQPWQGPDRPLPFDDAFTLDPNMLAGPPRPKPTI